MSAPCKTSYSLEVLKWNAQPFIESSKKIALYSIVSTKWQSLKLQYTNSKSKFWFNGLLKQDVAAETCMSASEEMACSILEEFPLNLWVPTPVSEMK